MAKTLFLSGNKKIPRHGNFLPLGNVLLPSGNKFVLYKADDYIWLHPLPDYFECKVANEVIEKYITA